MDEDLKYTAILSNSDSYHSQKQLVIGYNVAEDLLFKEIENNGGIVDLLFYPLFFCARHSIELQLKLLINIVNDFNNYRKNEKNTIRTQGHELKKLNNKLYRIIKNSDRRIIAEYEKVDVDNLLDFFDKNDPKSQSFRYAVDNEGKSQLENSINILKPHKDYNKLYSFLEWLEEAIDEMYAEYNTHTHTKNLSRNDLEIIARLLPNKKEWVDQSFLQVKESIKKEYGLSNNEFSDALNVIKTNPYLCSFIGMEIPEEGFSDSFFMLYNNLKDTAKKIESRIDVFRCKKEGYPSIISVKELSTDQLFSTYINILSGHVSKLTDNDRILFNTYRCIRKYCEEYEHQKENFSEESSSAALYDYTCNQMTSNGFSCFEKGLRLCGRTTVLKKLGIS